MAHPRAVLQAMRDGYPYRVRAALFHASNALLSMPQSKYVYLYEKIVKRRRGGVCYELNTAFFYLLRAMGFDADQISGRCHVNEPMTGHVFNLVRLREGECIADGEETRLCLREYFHLP
jgi:hypothetical protein